MTLPVPVYKDIQSTEKVAQQVNATLKEIESRGGRIDTQAFAMLAAYHYAVLLEEAQTAERENDATLVKALEKLSTKLQNLLREMD